MDKKDTCSVVLLGSGNVAWHLGKAMLENGIISRDDYRVIDTMLRVKYSPIFVEKSYQIPLDNKRE